MPLSSAFHSARRFCRDHPIFIILACLSLLLATATALVFGLPLLRQAADQFPPLQELRQEAMVWLASIPAPLYFLALVVLPAVGAPMTLFYLTALPVLGTHHPAIGVALVWLALALNMIFCRLLTHRLFYPAIQWILRQRHLAIPSIQPANEWKLTLAVRLSPLPFSIQNYLLALGHARWFAYLWLSLPIQAAIALAVMLLGQSVLTGGLSTILLAVCGLFFLNLLLHFLRQHLRRDTKPPA